MATQNQIAANRRNAQRSTGPITPEGKQASSRNALQSGIYAEKEVLPFENPTQLTALIAEYHDRWYPTTPEARALVDSLVHHEWLLRRLRRTPKPASTSAIARPANSTKANPKPPSPPAASAANSRSSTSSSAASTPPSATTTAPSKSSATSRPPRPLYPTPPPAPNASPTLRNRLRQNPLPRNWLCSRKMIFSAVSVSSPPLTP